MVGDIIADSRATSPGIRSDRRFAVIQLGEGDLGIGVDEGLLVDPPDALQGADIKRILGAAIAP